MQQPRVSKDKSGCTCSGWAEHASRLQELLSPEIEKQPSATGTFWSSFRYCPWCGQLLAGAEGRHDKILFKACRKQIEQSFFAKDEWGTPQTANMLVAARPITDYRQRSGDIGGTLDLMLVFVETGTRFTLTYGDIDEPFYEGLELMIDDFRELLFAHPHFYQEAKLAQRLEKLVHDAGWLGWGYGDYVTEQVAEIQQHLGEPDE